MSNIYPTIISFYTKSWEYEKHANRLRKECDKLKLSYYIKELPDTGDWLKNTVYKASFIYDALVHLKTPVLWIDVDGSIYNLPTLLKLPVKYDFMGRHQRTGPKRTWHVGTLFFNYTDKAIEFARLWKEASLIASGTDEAMFERIWKIYANSLELSYEELPSNYFIILGVNEAYSHNVVICHRLSQAESKLEMKRKQNSGSTIKPPSVIPSWWATTPKPGNFGDILTPYIVEKLTGIKPKWVPATFDQYPMNLLAVGSIIRHSSERTVVWGSGAMSMKTEVSNRAEYKAVRGPLTRQIILDAGGKCPEIYGDPALVLPKFYYPKITKKYAYGIIPHYVDYELVSTWYKNNKHVTVINLLNADVEKVIDEILQCENIISSSLHGIITAHAYGLNAAWVKFSDKLMGDGMKFHDHYASVGLKGECVTVNKRLCLEDMMALPYTKIENYNVEALLNAFPYKDFNL